MPYLLTLLDDVCWSGSRVNGERPRALLAALVDAAPRAVAPATLVTEVWPDEPPSDPGKAVQVVVSRTRRLIGNDRIEHGAAGYRWTATPGETDATALAELTRRLEDAAATDDWPAVAAAGDADPAAALMVAEGNETDAVDTVRAEARDRLRTVRRLRGIAANRLGRHEDACALLEDVCADGGAGADGGLPDEQALDALLGSLAAVRGPAFALERYERYRSRLADRLGTDPGPTLRQRHRSLLAMDSPVRQGVREDQSSLIGRDEDVGRLRSLLRSSRVVTILGAGGLGKTRLAHVLARDAEQSVVHVVELAGVTAPEEVLPAVATALGVRDAGARTRRITADLRTRVIEALAASPTLLVLDNCEHVIEAAAALTALVVAQTPQTVVLTTSRAPLDIASEHVYQLGQLGRDDAVALFAERATAARPGVVLDTEEVARLVERLDGLPLAIELAAARVRVMSVRTIADRLGERFALLRGGVRDAPARHQTLLAVIDWSWNLLAEPERRALGRLSLFSDGFSADGAEAVLGDDGLALVEGLAAQSLVLVTESGGEPGAPPAGTVRYRMLETVREFGRDRLGDGADDVRIALRTWATGFARRAWPRLHSPDQLTVVAEVAVEQNNLTAELQRALDDEQPRAVAVLAEVLGEFWSIASNVGRIMTFGIPVLDELSRCTPETVVGWADDEVDALRSALARVIVMATLFAGRPDDGGLAALAALGEPTMPRVRAVVHAALGQQSLLAETEAAMRSLDVLCADDDRLTALLAQRWRGHVLENAGDPAGALAATEAAVALCDPADGPFTEADIRAERANLLMHVGRRAEAVVEADLASPTLAAVGADEVLEQLEWCRVLADVERGDVGSAAERLRRGVELGRGWFHGVGWFATAEAQVAVARGDMVAAMRWERTGLQAALAIPLPDFIDRERMGAPWMLFNRGVALSVAARGAGTGSVDDTGADLAVDGCAELDRAVNDDRDFIDFPVCGTMCFGLADWGSRWRILTDDQIRTLFALSLAFGYNRAVVTTDWSEAREQLARFGPETATDVEALAASWDRDAGLTALRRILPAVSVAVSRPVVVNRP